MFCVLTKAEPRADICASKIYLSPHPTHPPSQAASAAVYSQAMILLLFHLNCVLVLAFRMDIFCWVLFCGVGLGALSNLGIILLRSLRATPIHDQTQNPLPTLEQQQRINNHTITALERKAADAKGRERG